MQECDNVILGNDNLTCRGGGGGGGMGEYILKKYPFTKF